MNDFIQVRHARVHNLKDVSLDIPHNQFTVITASPAPGNLPWPSTQSTPKGSGGSWNPYPPMRGSSSIEWKNPTSRTLPESPHPSPSGRRTPPQSPIYCSHVDECYDFLRLLYARAGRTFCSKLQRAGGTRHHRSGGGAAALVCPGKRDGLRCFRSPTGMRLPSASACLTCARKASRGSTSRPDL